MDILKSYDIPYKGLCEGKHRFDFKLTDMFFQAFGGAGITRSNAYAEVELTKSATLLELDFVIRGEVALPCDRCMEECELPVDYQGGFKVRFGETEDDFDGDLMWLSHAESELNVAAYIYESIVLLLPYKKVHQEREDGTPGCDPQILERVKIISEEEFKRAEQASQMQKMEENPEWQKLRELKDKL